MTELPISHYTPAESRAYDLSADLRTPLASIAGYVELLLDGQFGSLTDEQRYALQVTQRNALRVAQLVNVLLEDQRRSRR